MQTVVLPILFTLLLATPQAPAGARDSADEAAVRRVVGEMFDAYARADLEGFMARWSRNSPDYAARRELLVAQFADTRDIRLKSLTVEGIVIEGERARARVGVEMTGTDASTGQPSARLGKLRRAISLVREASGWKVWRYVPVEQALADALSSAASPVERQRLLKSEAEFVTLDLVRLLLNAAEARSGGGGADGGRPPGRGARDAAAPPHKPAASPAERQRLLKREAEFVTLDLVRLLLNAAEARSGGGDADGGLRLVGVAFEAADATNKPATPRAWCYWYRGSIHESAGRRDEALKDYEQSAALYRQAGEAALTALLLNTTAELMHKMGRRREAVGVADDALKFARAAGHKGLETQALNLTGLLRESAGDYAAALAAYEESLKRARAEGRKGDESGVLGNIGVVLRKLARYADALRAYEASLRIEQEAKNDIGVAQARLNIAGVHESLGRHSEALAEYERLLEFFRARGLKDEESKTLNNIGGVRLNTGDYEGAFKAFDASLRLKQAALDRPGEALALNNLANFYLTTARYGEAERLYRESLKLKQEMNDRAGVAAVLNNLGSVYKAAGDYDAALASFRESLAINRAINDPAGAANALNNVGLVHASRGEVADALLSLEESLNVARRIGDRAVEARVLQNIGVVYDTAGRADDALTYLERARVIEEQIGNRAGVAAVLHNRAGVYDELGRPDDALAEYAKALAEAQAIGDQLLEAQTRHNMATALLRAGRRDDARAHLEAALKFARESRDRDTEAVLLNTLAEFHLAAGRTEDADRALTDSLTISTRSGDADTALRSYDKLGDILRERGEWHRAANAYRRAVSYAESIRTDAREHTLQIGLFGQYVDSYHGLALSLLGMNDAAESFAASERAKARALVGLMQGGRASVAKAATAAERAEERRLLDSVAALTLQLDAVGARGAADESEITRVAARLAEARAAYDEFSRRLFLAHPELEVQRAQFEPADLTQLNQTFFTEEPGLCVLSYFVGKDETILYVITRGPSPVAPARLAARRLPLGGAAALDLINRFREKLGAGGAAGPGARRGIAGALAAARNYEAEARALYDALLAPAKDELSRASHLVVVADPLLASLPFHALMDERKQHLVARHSVSYAPSATALLKMRARSRQLRGGAARASALAVGRPRFDGRLADLPASETEVRAIGALLGSRPLLGAAASEARVKASAGRARYLHFATHGLLNETAPMYSAVALARGDGDDGALHARELMEMNLTAELAVLSACDTARGRRAGGEGVLGLTWSLFVAGVPSSVVTQWAVADRSTSELMIEFYRQLKGTPPRRPVSKAEALRRAQLKLIADARYKRPYYWAPFVLVGEWQN